MALENAPIAVPGSGAASQQGAEGLGSVDSGGEAALRESEDRLRLALAASGMGVWEWNIQTNAIYWSPECFQIVGVESFSGTLESFSNLIHPEDTARLWAAVDKALANRTLYEVDFRIIRPNGEVRWLTNHGQASYDNNGKAFKLVGTVQDITDRTQAEEELRRSRADLAEAQRVAKIGNWRFDTVTNRVSWSQELYRIFGFPEGTFDRTYQAFVSVIHPDDRERVVQVGSLNRATGNPFEIEYRILTPGGEIKDIREVGYALRDPQGAVVGLFGTAQDITERKLAETALRESENRFMTMFRSSPIPTGMSRLDTGVYVEVNDAFLALYGYDRTEIVGHTSAELGLWPQRDQRESLLQLLSKSGSVRGFEAAYRTKSGRTGDCLVSAALVGFAGQLHLFGMILDYTERKHFQDELQASRAQLRALAAHLETVREEERARLAREIHDVLAQELTALKIDISLVAGLATKRLIDSNRPFLAEKLASMTRTADRTLQAVQKIATELRPLVLDSLGLGAAIEWQAREFQARFGIVCKTHLPLEELPLAREPSTALFRILQESLINVARHSGANQVNIFLTTDGQQVTLAVQDNGGGIPAEKIHATFSIGLLGMRERALLLGGSCEICRAPAGGTVVEVRLPLCA